MLRKTSTFFLTIAMLALISAGSAWPTGTVVNGYDYGDTGGQKLPITDKPLTLTYFVQEHDSTPFNKDWTIWKNLSEATGITFDFIVAGASSFEQKMRLLYSTNDLPDIVETRFALASEFGSQGGIANVNDSLSIMPNYSKLLSTNQKMKSMVTTLDGKSYYLPGIYFDTWNLTWLYRSDIFKQQGITPPQDTVGLVAALKKLKSAYPDVYPMINRQGIKGPFGLFSDIAPQWKTGYNMYWDQKLDTYKFGPIEDNYKRMLMFLNSLYSQELLDPEWATLATKQWEDKLINGRGFVTVDWVDRIESMLPASRQVNPAWTLSALMPIVEKGFGEPKIEVQNAASEYDGFLVPANSKHKNEAFKVLDFMYSPAGAQLTAFGKIGDTAVKGADGRISYTKNVQTPANPAGKNAYDAYYGFQTLGSYTWQYPDLERALFTSPEIFAAWDMYKKANVAFVSPTLKYTEIQRSQIAEIQADINDFCDSQTASFVVHGNFKDWDAYVAKVKSLKVDKLVELYNQVYKQSK